MNLPKKRLDHQERPQHGTVVALTRLMLIDQHPDRRGVEQPRILEHRSVECLAQPSAQRAAKPSGERYGEALLGTVEDRLVNMRFEGSLKDIFALTTLQL